MIDESAVPGHGHYSLNAACESPSTTVAICENGRG